MLPANQAPVLDAIGDRTVAEGGVVSFTAMGTDPDAGDARPTAWKRGPTGATLNPSTGLFTWSAADGPRAVTVTVRVSDNGAPSLWDTETFTITVNNVAPSLGISGPSTIKEGEVYSLNLSASDPGDDNITLWSIHWGDGSEARIRPGTTTTATHVYLSPGSYLVMATATDEDGTFVATPQISLAVRPLNSPPDAADDSYTVDEDGVLVVPMPGVLGNDVDVDGESLHAVVVSDPLHGTLVLNPNGSFTYMPHANYFGADTFTYLAGDGTLLSGDATVTLTVNPVNDTPSTSGIADVAVDEDGAPTVISLHGAFADVEDPDSALTYSIQGNTNPGLFSGLVIDGTAGTLTLSYTPNAHGNGVVTGRATDREGASVDTSFTVTVNPVNDAPMAVAQMFSTDEDAPIR